jgi:gluconate 2-dehydrogenase gamma chain
MRGLPMHPSEHDVLLTRRQFVAAGAVGSAAIAIGCHSSEKQGSWDFLSGAHARTLAALCDQIIPADDFPSASQTGVVTYIDRQLARHYQRHQDAYRSGLDEAEASSRQRFGRSLADVPSSQQYEIAIALEQQNSAFFELMRRHTFEGYYGSPRHGGNRDAASWRMLGLAEPPLLGRAQYDLRNGGRS